ncbi:nuclear transport factor 2 family protein [Streptococcus dentapri]|uniref:Nuclear transport factor 2 family protein n=1 Tax=Streptococcus dentapri TaxID=573564 RepID=A0ABV8CZA3_9STRE
MKTFNNYFYLSDLAVQDKNSLQKLCQLFDPEAVIEANDGHTYIGDKEIIPFFKSFFSRNLATRHLWDIQSIDDGVFQANWAVVGQRKSGDYFTLTGRDIATIKNNKIIKLKIIGDQ